MHQHPRSPAPTAPSVSARSNSPRSQDVPNSPTSDIRMNNSRGSGSEAELSEEAQKAKEAMTKLNQIISV